MSKVKLHATGEEFSLEEIATLLEGDGDRQKFYDPAILWELDKPENTHLLRRGKLKQVVELVTSKHFMRTDGGHNCYWNDGFYAAHRFGLNDHTKRTTAIVALWNGRHGYWEWRTHQDFDTARLLKDMRIITEEQAIQFRQEQETVKSCYVSLPRIVHNALRARFNLTREELMAAPLLCPCIWDKERTGNRNSGQYSALETAYEID